MASFKKRMDSGFEKMTRAMFRHRRKVLLLIVALLLFFTAQIPFLKIDASTESFFRQDDPNMVDLNAFRDQFGRGEMIVVAIQPKAVFDEGFLTRLAAFHTALEESGPYVKEVNSLINVRNTRGESDTLVVEDLLAEIPKTPEAMARLKKRVLSSKLYPNLLISEDGRFTTVVIETLAFSPGEEEADVMEGFDDTATQPVNGDLPPRAVLTDKENSAAVTAVREVMARFNSPDFPVYVSGMPVVTDYMKRAMQGDMRTFMLLAMLAIGLFLLLFFRRLSGVLLPLGVVLISLFSTVGLMSLTGIALKMPHTILPSFLLAVGVGAVVHLLAIFYRHFQEHQDKEAAMVHAMAHSGLPIVMTSLTTAAGLFSFSTAKMGALAELGLFAGLGVLISLVYTLTFVPVMVSLVPIKVKTGQKHAVGSSKMDAVLLWVANFSTRNAWPVLLVSLALVGAAATGLPKLIFSHNTIVWFPETSEIRQSTTLIDKNLKGSLTLELVLDTQQENGLHDPEILQRMEALETHALNFKDAKGRPFVGKTNALTGVVKEINQALNENRSDFYTIPQDRQLVAQELLLFENSGSDDLKKMVDTRFSKGRVSMKVPWNDAATYVDFVSEMEREGKRLFDGKADLTVTGILRLFTEAIHQLMISMLQSYTIALVVISIMMILLIGRFGLGLLSMIPNLSPILITLGMMGWLGIRLDTFTLLIGGIALGLAVDDTIHFFHNFIRYYQLFGNAEEAVRQTFLSTGRAMFITTMVLVAGFWLFMFARLNNLFNFGLLTGVTLLLALAAVFFVVPAMMEVLYGDGKRQTSD